MSTAVIVITCGAIEHDVVGHRVTSGRLMSPNAPAMWKHGVMLWSRSAANSGSKCPLA